MIDGVALDVHDPLLAGNAHLGDYTALFGPTWRRSIQRIGGYFTGTTELTEKDLTAAEMREWFRYGLLREIRERGGGVETWRGFAAKMELTEYGDTQVVDIADMANAIRSIYTRIGDNVLTNGSGESGAWAAYNGATVVQDATWATHGTYSIKITVADTVVRGATIQATIAVTAGIQYLIRATLRVTSGSWRFSTNRADNDKSLAHYSTHGTAGDHTVEIMIPDSNDYTGNVDLRITSEGAAGVINADAVVFQEGPRRAETTWYLDRRSIAVHGRKENVLLRSGMSDAAANAECQRQLIERAWANALAPRTGQTYPIAPSEKRLRIVWAGYWAMLNWLTTTLHGTRTASEWVRALAGLQSAYIAIGSVSEHNMDYLVEDEGPLALGDILRNLANAGDVDGAKYGLGVYAGRRLNYELIPEALTYYRTEGQLLTLTRTPIEPWLARPGWALYQDLPIGPGSLTSHLQHDPRWQYIESVEMLPDGTLSINADEGSPE